MYPTLVITNNLSRDKVSSVHNVEVRSGSVGCMRDDSFAVDGETVLACRGG